MNLLIKDNYIKGNKTTQINKAASTSLKTANNIGYNPLGFSNITLTQSPYQFNVGNCDTLVNIKGGTVSEINLNGVTIANKTDVNFLAPANMTVAITYSDSPTVVLFKQ